MKKVKISNEELIGKYVGKDYKNGEEEIIKAGFDIDQEVLKKIIDLGISKLDIVNIDPINKGPYILETLKVEKIIIKTKR